ncbi:MAG: hypothetical protein HYV68_02205 [Candidatus Taylorbacteria bacterium]|nr:hypothetical protein [Candidatus Taylorbacteria bacterium]
MLRKALRKYNGLRQQVDNVLLGDEGDLWEAELKNFLAKRSCWVTETPKRVEILEPPEIIIPNLRTTGPTLGHWLAAREELHKFWTGDTIVLRDMFAFTEEQLARTDVIPVFRPVGATNRLAVDWKKKLGISVYEEVDVMGYKNSGGPKKPELYLINRSVRPDEDTLGEGNKKSPDQLIVVPKKIWAGLYGWCDADSLHFAITENHLDPETVTWFPKDRLADGRVARGDWYGARVYLCWHYSDDCYPRYGARATEPVPFRT